MCKWWLLGCETQYNIFSAFIIKLWLSSVGIWLVVTFENISRQNIVSYEQNRTCDTNTLRVKETRKFGRCFLCTVTAPTAKSGVIQTLAFSPFGSCLTQLNCSVVCFLKELMKILGLSHNHLTSFELSSKLPHEEIDSAFHFIRKDHCVCSIRPTVGTVRKFVLRI